MATKRAGKAAADKSASGKAKKFFEPGGDPIIIGGGGGGGRPKRRGQAAGSYLLIGFNRAFYKDKPKPKKWEHKGASLDAFLIYVNGLPLLQQPTTKPTSTIVVQCLCASGSHNIVITGKDLGIDIPDDCADLGDSFICRGCTITDILVDGKSVFSTVPGPNVGVKVLNS